MAITLNTYRGLARDRWYDKYYYIRTTSKSLAYRAIRDMATDEHQSTYCVIVGGRKGIEQVADDSSVTVYE